MPVSNPKTSMEDIAGNEMSAADRAPGRSSGRWRRTWIWPSIDYHIVQYIARLLGLMGSMIMCKVSDELMYQVFPLFTRVSLRTHDSGLESQSQTDTESLVENFTKLISKVLKVELGQETQRAERKGYYRWHDVLKEPACV